MALLDKYISRPIQTAIVATMLTGALGKIGFDMSTLKADVSGAVEVQANTQITLSNIVERMEFVMEKQYTERKKSWTLNKDIEQMNTNLNAKLDTLLERSTP